jgi:4-hydroxy-tetrahydrodipicolinate reductase
MIDVVVSGVAGRLGRRIAWAVANDPALQLAGGVDAPGAPSVGVALSVLAGVERAGAAPVGDALAPLLDAHAGSSASVGGAAGAGRVVVVETAPKRVALAHAEAAAARGAALLVATTGFDAAERRTFEAAAERVPVLVAPNLSLGVTVLLELVRQASRALEAYDLEIVEMHHNQKVDAPSGTAWALGRAAAEGRGQDVERDAILARAGEVGKRGKQEIGIQTLRGGGVIGEHTVFVVGEAERLELTHRAQSRDVFALGAARAARFLGAPERAPGLYAMRDVLGLGGGS